MKRVIAAVVAASVVSVSLAYAASHGAADPVMMRKNGMQGVGLAMGQLAGMAKGQIPFDQKTAISALKTMNYAANSVGQYFPEGSDMAADTTSAPKIWEDKAGFDAAMAKFAADTAAAIASPPDSQEALGGVLGSVGGNCKACHEGYRVKKG